MGYLRKKRCPAGDRPLSTSSVLLLHICQYTSTCHQGCHITSLYVSITLLLISKISTTCIFQFVCHSLFWFVIGLFFKKNFLLLRFVVFLDLSFLVKVQFYLFRVFFPHISLKRAYHREHSSFTSYSCLVATHYSDNITYPTSLHQKSSVSLLGMKEDVLTEQKH